jgi:uncharacterized protein YkwD
MLTLRTTAAATAAVFVALVTSTAVVSSASVTDDAATAHDSAERLGNARLVADPPPPPAQPAADPAAEVVASANVTRAAAGLPPLTMHPSLQQAALGHSRDQAARNTMSHTGSDGSTVGDRLTAAGYLWWTCAENVASGYATPSAVMDAWLASAGHRRNIVNPDVVHVGVAVAYSASGVPYWTMDVAA